MSGDRATTVATRPENILGTPIDPATEGKQDAMVLNQNGQTQKGAFGAAASFEKTPQVQVKFPYGLNSKIIQTLANKSGSSATATGGYAKITCAGAADAYSQLRTLDTLRYGPGQGAEIEGTYAWITGGVADSIQIFGGGDDDEGFFFGYNGASFGILNRSLGSLEIKSLTISNTATGSGNITITMDGTAVTVAITSGWTVAETTEAIVAAAADFANAGRGWEIHTDNNVSVEFISFVSESAGGTFSFVDTDATGVAGVFSQTITGAAPTNIWVAQGSWNIDPMDSTGPSTQTLSYSNLNVYKIQFQYLGAGAVEFFIENVDTGRFQLVHVIKYAGTAQIPTLRNPTLHLTGISKTESGYSGPALETRTASMGGFIQGKETNEGVRFSASSEKTMSTTEQVLLIIHNEIDFNSQINKVSVFPDFLTVATEATKPTKIALVLNPTRINGGAVLNTIDPDSVMKEGSTGTTIVGGQVLATIEVESGNPKFITLRDFNIRLRPGDRIIITGQISSGSSAPTTAGVTWLERI